MPRTTMTDTMAARSPNVDAFGERMVHDLLGEALRRHRHGSIRPLWRDMPEGEQKRAWRALGMKILEHGYVLVDELIHAERVR